MTENSSSKPPVWYWVVAIIALFWNAMGVMQYLGQAYDTESFRTQYTAEQLEVLSNTPAWATAAFAIGVFGGIIGSIFLLLKKKLAYIFFLFSLIGVMVQMYYNLFVVKSADIYGPGAIIMTVLILALAIVFLWFSKHANKKGWIQ